MNDPFPAYALSEEHELLRADGPRARRGQDRPGGRRRRPDVPLPAGGAGRAHRGRPARGAHPSGYGGEGADALATVIVIEEVARACASSSLIPAVNKLGTVPLLLSGVRGAQAALPAAGRPGRGDVLLRAVRAGGGLGRGRHEDPGRARRRRLGAERHQAVDHQRRRVAVLHGDGRDRPRQRAPTASPRSSWTRTTRASASAHRSTSSASRARPPGAVSSTTRGSRPTG